ncbi:hypothetical protein CVT25_008239 [Psilocybe cyanescens]|uniref:Uncharacterized protein n=1 Tax=Psilocybe cyanescens TaxID=93625 RepID=A0A409X6S2_PSICY|nr:hypothetical protein CVT25_008239 [Psilocybe cyanescens]
MPELLRMLSTDALLKDTPRASAGFVQPSPALAPTSTSRFNPKKLLRKFPGLCGGGTGQAPTSPAVDVQGNLVPPVRSGQGVMWGYRRRRRIWRKRMRRSGGAGLASDGSREVEAGAGTSSSGGSGSDTGVVAGGSGVGAGASRRPAKLRDARRRKSNFEFKGVKNNIVGIVMLEIQGADDLHRLADSTEESYNPN